MRTHTRRALICHRTAHIRLQHNTRTTRTLAEHDVAAALHQGQPALRGRHDRGGRGRGHGRRGGGRGGRAGGVEEEEEVVYLLFMLAIKGSPTRLLGWGGGDSCGE